MKTNFGSGRVQVGLTAYPIIWDGEHAQHVADNFFIVGGDHIMLHKEIQQCLSSSVIYKRTGTNRKYFGIYNHKLLDCIIFTTFLLNSKFVAITTSYKMGGTKEMAAKQKRGKAIKGIDQTFTMDDDTLQRVMNDLDIDNPDDAQSIISQAVAKLPTANRRKVISLKP